MELVNRFSAGVKALVATWMFGQLATGGAEGSLFAEMLFGAGRRSYDPPRRHSASMEEGYRDLPWVRAALSRIADGVAQPRWHLHKGVGTKGRRQGIVRAVTREAPGLPRIEAIRSLVREGDLAEVPRHPLIEMIQSGNPALTGFDQRRLTAILCDLVGECYWVTDRRSGVRWRGWVVPASWVKTFPTPADPFWLIRYRGFSERVPAADVIRFANPDPANPYGRGSGQAQALADELGADEAASKHLVKFFFRGGRPDAVVSGLTGDTGKAKESSERMERRWRAKGFAGLPIFFGPKVDVKELGHPFYQMQMAELKKHLRDAQIQSLGVPPELFGILSSSNRSTIGLALEIHHRCNTLPRLIRLQETLEPVMAEYPGVAENAVLSFDNPIDRDREHELKVARAQPHSLTQNEWRGMSGHEPVEGGDVHLVTNRFRSYERLDQVELIQPRPADADEDREERMLELEEAVELLREAA